MNTDQSADKFINGGFVFSQRYISVASIIVMIFVITLGFNNCGEGFQGTGFGTGGLSSQAESRPPLVKTIKHLSIAKQPRSINIKNPSAIYKLPYSEIYAVISENETGDQLHYGSIEDLFSGNYKTAAIPDFEEAKEGFNLRSYSFRNDKLQAIFYGSDGSRNDIFYQYSYNNGTLKPYFYFSDSEENFEEKDKKESISQNWDYYFSYDSSKKFIRNSQTGEEIPVLETHHRHIKISDDEKWFINLRSDNQCYITNFATKQFFKLGASKLTNSCANYIFLTNDILISNDKSSTSATFFNNIGPVYSQFYNNSNLDLNLKNIELIDYKKSKRVQMPGRLLYFEKSNNILSYIGDDGNLKKQYLSDFMESAPATVTYPMNNQLVSSFGTPFSQFFGEQFEFIQPGLANQDQLIYNHSTGQNININELELNPGKNKNLSRSHRYTLAYYDKGFYLYKGNDYYKISFNDSPTETNLPEYNCDISTNLKTKLSETCLWDLVNTEAKYKNFFEYNVRFGLISESLKFKSRWVYIPPGTNIDNTDDNNWIYPQGTILYKNFAYSENFNGESQINVETRVLEKISTGVGPDAWRPSVYLWNEGQTDATLTEDGADVTLTNNGEEYTYKVPSTTTCNQCHMSNNDMVAGFTHFQLDSGFGKLSSLYSHYEKDLLTKAPTEYNDIPQSGGGYSQKAIGNLHVNCAGCHSPKGVASFFDLDFTYKLGTTDHKQTSAYVTGLSSGLIKPGDAEASRVYKAVEAGTMPKGAVLKNIDLTNALKFWINSLDAVE